MPEPKINLATDGEDMSPRDYAELLADLTRRSDVAVDSFGLGGPVTAFEERFARMLGKEKAIVMPTGTLANLLALKLLTRDGRRRVFVQSDSHIYMDTGDGWSSIAGLTLVALQDRGVGFGASAMQQEMIRAASARVAVPFGAVSIETPVRRRQGETFPADALAEVVDFARRHDLRLHLDGARIFIVAAFAGQDVKSFAAPFDTVYVSLYKYFGCPFGAILAGPAALLDGLHHERRRHGGGLYQMWPLALVAGHFLDEQERKWQGAAARGREVLRRLDNGSGLAVETLAHGSNIFRLRLNGGDRRRLDDFRETGKAFGLTLPEVVGDALPIRVNATWLRASADDIAGRLQRAAATLSPASP